jgi:site-specific recombinase XerD
MENKSIQYHIQDFLNYLEIEKNRSRQTIRNYAFYLRRFFQWMEKKKQKNSVHDIDSEIILDYRLWLNRLEDKKFRKTIKKNTQTYHLIALRAFLKYLARQDVSVFPAEKIELAKVQERQIECLEEEELQRLLEAPLKAENVDNHGRRSQNQGMIVLRDKAILELLFCSGLRVSELTSLKRDEINLKKGEFTIRGKGGKLRVVFLSDTAEYWLKQYLDRRKDMNWSMFVSHDRAGMRRERDEKGLTPRSIQRIVEYYAKCAGIPKKVTPHSLRHTFATDLLRNGADIRSVQTLLGHSSITTTQIYTHVTDRHLRDVYEKYHGKRNKRE